MNAYLLTPILALLAIVQSSLVSQFHLFGGAMNLILLAVVSWSLVARSAPGKLQSGTGPLVVAFAGGLLLDLFSGAPLGASAAALVLVVYLTGFTEGRLWGSHVLLPLAASLLGSMVYYLLTLGALALTGRQIDFVPTLNYIILPSAFLNLVFTLPVYNITRRFHALFHPRGVAI